MPERNVGSVDSVEGSLGHLDDNKRGAGESRFVAY